MCVCWGVGGAREQGVKLSDVYRHFHRNRNLDTKYGNLNFKDKLTE